MIQAVSRINLNINNLGKRELDKALDSSIYDYARKLIREIVNEYYSGRNSGKGVNRITGQARYGWKYTVRKRRVGDDTKGTLILYNTSSHYDFSEKKTIRAKKNFMAVPLAGATNKPQWGKRFPGGPAQARQLFNDDTMTVKLNGKIFIVRKSLFKQDMTNPSAYLYVLKKVVKVPAYTKGLSDFANQKMNLLLPALEASLRKEFGNGV